MSNQHDAAARRPVQVYIFNQTYNLRSASDEEHVRRLAGLVDQRMRQISELLPNHDALKVAVMAALHIAEELENVRASQAEQHAAPRAEETTPERDERAARRTWFEDVFDSEFTGDRDGGRLSARVSERLQTRKQERRTPLPSAEEDTERG